MKRQIHPGHIVESTSLHLSSIDELSEIVLKNDSNKFNHSSSFNITLLTNKKEEEFLEHHKWNKEHGMAANKKFRHFEQANDVFVNPIAHNPGFFSRDARSIL
jgi:hypothetical protein